MGTRDIETEGYGDQPPFVQLGPQGILSIAELMAAFPALRWKVHPTPEGGKTAFAVCGGNRSTGEVLVFAAIEGGSGPRHRHTQGERTATFAGELQGVLDNEPDLVLRPGTTYDHEPGSIHTPRADTFWCGFYQQPAGSELI